MHGDAPSASSAPPATGREPSGDTLAALVALGLTEAVQAAFRELLGASPSVGTGAGAELGRVVAEHRGGYLVSLGVTERLALLAGHLRRAAEEEGASRPAVGDWVAITQRAESRRAADTAGAGQEPGLIVERLPQKNRLSRKAAGVRVREQVLCANVDQAFIVDAPRQGEAEPGAGPGAGVDLALNLGRLGRYVALVREGGVRPVILIGKIDLLAAWGADPEVLRRQVTAALPGVEVHLISCATGAGLDGLVHYVDRPLTSVLLGPSGVGKSSLLKALAAGEQGSDAASLIRTKARVQSIGAAGKGRHTTTHRELFRLPQGGLVIDTPGMRELGLWEGSGPTAEGLREAFPEIDELAADCRFRDCGHESEPGCAVQAAARRGEILVDRLLAYQKLAHEARFIEEQATVAARVREKKNAAQRTRALDSFYKRRGR
ncbi:MAG: ribosome small subunit-dependent GTPase A [Polyangia bacterium]